MIREIKFRAFIKHSQKMANVTEFYIERQYVFTDHYGYALSHGDIYLMQYTGLKDKNGVEIYEGDVVACWDECGFENISQHLSGKVDFNGGCFCVVDCGGYHNRHALTCAENVEVIGNIHQNPELLS